VPVGVTGQPASEPSGSGAKLDPPDHTQPKPAPPWTQRVAPLIARLVFSTQRPVVYMAGARPEPEHEDRTYLRPLRRCAVERRAPRTH
jgi:hypothetical protein